MAIFLLIIGVNLHAYSDSDMDGVENIFDKCPNTPITELVDIRGCTIDSTVSQHHYDIIVGGAYAQTDYTTLEQTDTLTSSLQVDYYYKNFSLQASTSYYSSDSSSYSDSGLNDSIVAGYYKFKIDDDLLVRVGLGTILPTYDTSLNNNNTDYFASLNLSYSIDKMNIFGGYIRTLVNDDDIPSVVSYNDTNAFNIGAGYYLTQKLYMSGAYNSTQSIYTTVEDIDTASLYAFYSIDNHWFSTASYAYGLSDSASDHYFSIRLGYYF